MGFLSGLTDAPSDGNIYSRKDGEWVIGGGGVTDHGALLGLLDDDHSQYALLAGRGGGNVFTGSISCDSFLVNNLSDLGTAILIKGTVKGLRLGTSPATGRIEGVDNTGVGSFQPLALGGATLALEIAQVPKLSIAANGDITVINNLGIGIVPTTTLDVKGAIVDNVINTVQILRGGGVGAGSGSALAFQIHYDGNYPNWTLGKIGTQWVGGATYGGDLVFFTNDGSSQVSLVSRMILTDTGKLGIGVRPTADLDIYRPTTDVSLNILTSFAGGSAYNYLRRGDLPRIASTVYGTYNVSDLWYTGLLYDGGNNTADYCISTDFTETNTQFRVKSTGVIAMPNLPTSAAGLTAGDLWVDTTGGLNIVKRV